MEKLLSSIIMKKFKYLVQGFCAITIIFFANYAFSLCLVKDREVSWVRYDSLAAGLCDAVVQNSTSGRLYCRDGNQGVVTNLYYEPFPWWDYSTINLWSYDQKSKSWILLQAIGYGFGVTENGKKTTNAILDSIPTVGGDPNMLAGLEAGCSIQDDNNQGPPPDTCQ